jgi:hypothetical protein
LASGLNGEIIFYYFLTGNNKLNKYLGLYMNTDFRVSVSLPTHPKCLKLMRRCGDRAFYCLIRFWAFVAQNRPDGNLKGLDIEDIEIACDWQGDAGSMHRALLELCFIEMLGDALVVHDWAYHNSFAIHAMERSQKAKKAAEVRWNTQKTCSEHAPSIANNMQGDASSNAPSPIPIPIPTNVKNNPPIPPPGGDCVSKYQYPDWLDKILWADFKRMRSKIKKPITTIRTVDRLLAKLKGLIDEGHNQSEIIQRSIDHCWQDFYAPTRASPTGCRVTDSNLQAAKEFLEDESIG